MKSINILSLVQACETLEEDVYKKYLDFYGIRIKNDEINDLRKLVDILNNRTIHTSIFNNFYVGYSIPQIGKEFDLLRFGNGSIINIELKKVSTEEKIRKQLRRNKYYLKALNLKTYNITFISSTEQFYLLNSDDSLVEIESETLDGILMDQEAKEIDNVDKLFNPSDYLVSPFNSTQKFINNEFFLTHQQEEIKKQIIKSFENKTKANYISVTGSAGTGKTLLVYDIARSTKKNGNKVIIFHCGYLNQGQEKLVRNGWNIVPIKNIKSYNLSSYDVIVIDEAQRIYPNQLENAVNEISSANGNCLFSYDKLQTLSSSESRSDIDSKIKNISNIKNYQLSKKIRTNKEIATFIKNLFNKNRKLEPANQENIEINFFNNLEDARSYLQAINNKWEVLRFTPSRFSTEHHEHYSNNSSQNSHKVIGQEFDNVAVIIDRFFAYDSNGELIYTGRTHYHPVKMLFQNITRARKKINIIIINNEALMNHCLSILKA